MGLREESVPARSLGSSGAQIEPRNLGCRLLGYQSPVGRWWPLGRLSLGGAAPIS